MKYFYDTEFLEDGRSIELISIGIVAEDGREFYAVNGSMDQQKVKAHPWLAENVWPHLPVAIKWPHYHPIEADHRHVFIDSTSTFVLPKILIAAYLKEFFKNDNEVELWAYYGAYDHVVLSWIFGPIAEQDEKIIPYYTNELVTLWKQSGRPEKPPEPEQVHHALQDARWNKKLYEVCVNTNPLLRDGWVPV